MNAAPRNAPIMSRRRALLVAGVAAWLAAGLGAAAAAETGEIRIGQTMPFSGVASAYGIIGQVEGAYLRKINAEQGGVNGRKVNLISLDDAYSPPKTVEQTRKLVEQENVLAVFGSVGTPTNLAVHKYLNSRKVPHLFVSSGASFWNQPEKYPWTIGWQIDYESEGKVYGKYVLKEKPDAKVAILYQHDDSGRDYIRGFKEGLGANAKKMIVAEASYQITDPTVDSQIIALRNSGADVLFTHATPKFGAQAIRKIYEIGWKPLHVLSSTTNTIAGTLKPAGFEKSQGVVSGFLIKDPGDPTWKDDPEVRDYLAFMKSYAPNLDAYDTWAVWGYTMAQGLVQTLRQAGQDVTPENIMKQARNLNFKPAMTLPGIVAKTGPNRNVPIQAMQLARFEGDRWKLSGEVIAVAE